MNPVSRQPSTQYQPKGDTDASKCQWEPDAARMHSK